MMSVTPDHHRKAGVGVTVSPSPFLTPRPERRRTDLRASDWGLNRQDRDKEVNVQVLLRCRPLSDDEQRLNVPRVINCNEHKREVSVVQNLANKQVDRVFTFDKVFGPKAQQRAIYDQAIVPIVNEVLDGFNCTVFAYGQTGTGKTYTMEGGMGNKEGDLSVEAGVIPRAVRQIVDTLEAQNADYSMKVTFLELYNEEVTDLLASEDNSRSGEDKQKKSISLMEDGKGCVVVRGLEEEAVYSANEIYTLLERGAAKRRTADTLLNKRSSRSHSVFSITILIKEAAIGDEDVIKCGKLNLVDLAGSENISRSGAREGRAREAGEINKSLLTLGRVINALVEHSAHIPYRDSKLTRLLRDSLGGKTKTCIIATISPTAQCLDETLSTLDYASRAKNIKNKPEANQKISKAVLLKDLYLEIEKMKEDVRSAREKNGVYIPHERFVKEEAEKKARNEKIDQLEIDLNLSEKKVDEYRELYLTEQEQKLDLESKFKDCQVNLDNTNKALLELQEDYLIAISEQKKKELVISKLMQSESSIIERTKLLRGDLQSAADDITSLFTKLDQKNKLESENRCLVLGFGCNLDQGLKELHKTILGSMSQQKQQLRCMEEHASAFLARKCDATDALEIKIKKMMETHTSGMSSLRELSNSLQTKTSSDLEQINSQLISQATISENFLSTSVLEAKEVIQDIKNSLCEHKELLAFSARQQEEGLQRSLAYAQLISKATMNFCNDLHHQASNFMIALEESHVKKSRQLENFENKFKEEAAKEEKMAMDKIAVILETLTSKKTTIVTEATRSIQESGLDEKKTLQQEISNMQQISLVANKNLSGYVQNVESHFMEDTISAAETRTMMENCLEESNKSLQYSSQLLDDSQISMNYLTKRNLIEMEANVQKSISTCYAAHEDFLSVSTAMKSEFDVGVSDIQAVAKDALMHDHQSKKEIESMTSSCLDQLKLVQEYHSECISDIRNQAEKCLTKNYLVDQHPNSPKKRAIAVPSLASIEGMRTHANENIKECKISENKTKCDNIESKQKGASPDRSPFTCVN